jgi:hypothetical protein
LGIHGPPEISEDITNMSLIRRHRKIETPTEVAWFGTSKQNKKRKVKKHLISDPYDLRMSTAFELAAYLKRRLDPTRTVPIRVAIFNWHSSRMNYFNFSPTRHLHRMVQYRQTHYDDRRGPLVKSPRPHHPLANELLLEQSEEVPFVQREPSIDSYIDWLEVYLPTNTKCPLRQREAICQNCQHRYETNKMFLGFQTHGQLCNECSKQHIEKLHNTLEQKKEMEEVKKKRWNWFRKRLGSSSDEGDDGKDDGGRKGRKTMSAPLATVKGPRKEKREKELPPARPEYLKPCPL